MIDRYDRKINIVCLGCLEAGVCQAGQASAQDGGRRSQEAARKLLILNIFIKGIVCRSSRYI